ncbi:hypothetical protein [Ralstonia pickettii]|uniref:hypothetical protein n=1 Tax=Ralstonia pickettii TaxID=329 RepID=UPI0015C1BCD1|nr:hypothetical protein [Ralstonia pickettii]NWK43822.1 hypothetical protein [Ralstonia pickettii]
MILFFGPYPTPENERDGMIQRVAAVDQLVADRPRHYIFASYRKHIRRSTEQRGLATIHRVNFFLHWFFILKWILSAERIYVHSAFNVIFALPAYLIGKCVITDVHGVVPEETRTENKQLKACVMSIAERVAVYRSAMLVCVTRRMAEHLRHKYPKSAESIVLPVFDQGLLESRYEREPSGDALSVIYAGGLQIWQNIELMLEFTKTHPHYNYLFLTPSPDTLRRRAELQGATSTNLTFSSCPHDQIAPYYAKADLGFLLRDNNIINNVACPTKAIEYMAHGIVPIVLNTHIGDFGALGARFLLLNEMDQPPTAEEILVMRKANFACLDHLIETFRRGSSTLVRLLVSAQV